eukprot:822222-Amphidinium_carterae.1
MFNIETINTKQNHNQKRTMKQKYEELTTTIKRVGDENLSRQQDQVHVQTTALKLANNSIYITLVVRWSSSKLKNFHCGVLSCLHNGSQPNISPNRRPEDINDQSL